MRTPDDILDQIRTRYANNWRDWLATPPDEQSFPLAPPSARMIAHDAIAVATWLRTWRAWADDHPTAHLRTAIRHTLIGDQQIYTHVDLPDVDSLIGLAPDLAKRWHTATQRYFGLSAFAVPPSR